MFYLESCICFFFFTRPSYSDVNVCWIEFVQVWILFCSALLCTLLLLNTVIFSLPLFCFLFFVLFCLLSWWKLSEASQSATVSTYTRLCPLLKVFLCCSTLWALSCLVSLLVTLLALTDSQVKCVLRAACVFVISAFPVCHISLSVAFHCRLSIVLDLEQRGLCFNHYKHYLSENVSF